MRREDLQSCRRRRLDVAGDGGPEWDRFSRDLMEVVVCLADPVVVYRHCVLGVVDCVRPVESVSAVMWGTGFGDAVAGGDGAAAGAVLFAVARDGIAHRGRCLLLRE